MALILGIGALSVGAAAQVAIVTGGLDQSGQVHMKVGRTTVLATAQPYKSVSVGQHEVVDINAIAPTSILLTAKKVGVTQLIVWDEQERSQVIDIFVEADIKALTDLLQKMFPDSKIEVTELNGNLMLRGRAPSLQTAEQAEKVATPFGAKIMNMLEIAGGQQVMLQVRFAEVSRQASTQLGVNFGYSDGHSFAANNTGQVSPLGIKESGGAAADLTITSPTPVVTIFGKAAIGDSALAYFISALRSNNLLRILAEPNLVTTSGQEASFLAGGEFPVPVPQGGAGTGGGQAITIQFKEFGVKLVFVPVVLGDGRIRMKVAPEVSDLDFTTALKFGGFVVPGLTSRKVETTVELGEGQTFAIAGLLSSNVTANKDVTPVLGDIPVLGALFRSVRYQRKETELVVLVTPRLVAALNPDKVPAMPGDNWRHPTESELFWKQDLGGPGQGRSDAQAGNSARAAPLFYGQFGFAPATQPAARPAGTQ